MTYNDHSPNDLQVIPQIQLQSFVYVLISDIPQDNVEQ